MVCSWGLASLLSLSFVEYDGCGCCDVEGGDVAFHGYVDRVVGFVEEGGVDASVFSA